ncbi:MAG TPA: hypothetical protein VH477_02315 [Bryobacteraceae bacterium]|jgi:hypothetical protein
MKYNQHRKGRPLAKPLLHELVKRHRADFKRVVRLASTGSSNSPTVGSTPLAPPDLYQDSGGGYNANLTLIQE